MTTSAPEPPPTAVRIDGLRVASEPFDSEDAVRLRAAARIDVDALAGRHTDIGLPFVASMVAEHVVARDRIGAPLGCAGLVAAPDGVYEIRRLFVRSEARRRGVARAMLRELEALGSGLGAPALVYETDHTMTAMLRFLESEGFHRIEPWGAYAGNPGSVAYAKAL